MTRTRVHYWPLVGALIPAVATALPDNAKGLTGLELGRYVFVTYCAGCHGFDGFAFFPSAPSFAMGDRLMKSDAELLYSIRKGLNAMPSWEDKLPPEWLLEALAYIRQVGSTGAGATSIPPPEYYYIFTPLGNDGQLNWPVILP